MDKQKTLLDLEFEQITDFKRDKDGNRKTARRKIVFTYWLRKLAIEYYKLEDNDNVKDFIKEFFNLNDEIINDNNKLINFQIDKTLSAKRGGKKYALTKEQMERIRKELDKMPLEEVY